MIQNAMILKAMNRNETHRTSFETGARRRARPVPLLAGLAVVCAALVLSAGRLAAQTADAPAPVAAQPAPAPAAAPAPRKKSKNPTGSLLDTLMSTRLWADVPEAKDFVRQARPPAETLDFKPTAGTDPERPTPRSKAELDTLQSELESAAQRNKARGGQLPAGKPPQAVAGSRNGRPGAAKTALPN